MLFHFTAQTPRPNAGGFVSRGVYDLLLGGWVGVDLFFVLSGFLITGILVDARGSDRYFRNFYVRRGLRIFPLYYAVLTVLLVVVPRLVPDAEGTAEIAAHGTAWFWAYLVNVLVAIHGWRAAVFDSGHLWSLAVEEQFYLLWPFVVQYGSRRTVVRVCLTLVLGVPLLRIALVLAHAPSSAVYVLLPTRADSLAYGALLALAARSPTGLPRIARWRGPAIAACLAGLGALFMSERGFDFEMPLVQTIGYSLVGLLASALVVTAITAPTHSAWTERVWTERALTSPMLRWLGQYSYGIYLVHHLIRRPLWERLSPLLLAAPDRMSWLARIAFMAAGIAVSAGLAALSWHLFERHFLRLKRFFPLEPRHVRNAPT